MSSFNILLQKISAALDPAAPSAVAPVDIERVSAMLLIEIARADHQIDDTEREVIVNVLAKASSLDKQELNQMISETMEAAEATISLHEHVNVINDKFSKQDKICLVEHMWRVAVADGDIDRYEDYTIRKLCDLMHIKHRDFMQAKHRVITGE